MVNLKVSISVCLAAIAGICLFICRIDQASLFWFIY